MRQLAYFNGKYVDSKAVAISVTDWGFVQGVTVAEQLRTFNGQAFRVAEHLGRLQHGLRLLGLESAVRDEDLSAVISNVVANNWTAIKKESVGLHTPELGVTVFVTPGIYPTYQHLKPSGQRGPVVCVHTYRLAVHRWAHQYQQGVELVTVTTRQVPAESWSLALKCRSRMHYFLAAREAEQLRSGSIALLLNQESYVSETPTSNIIAYFEDRGIVAPPAEHALTGISMQHVFEIAEQLEIPATVAPLRVQDLARAAEVWVSSTPYCLLPVRVIDGQVLEKPWSMFERVMNHWSRLVGIDIIGQAVAGTEDNA